MARRRYQRGHLRLRGKREKVWVAMWREDVIAPDGTTRRIRKSEVLGTLKEYKTRRLAERALEQRLSDVNSLTYKLRPTATFSEFAKKWQTDVLSQHKRSTQSADKSRIRKHLDPELGSICMKDISRELLQAFVARKATILSAKSVRNLIALLGEMWVQARADGYTQLDPFANLRSRTRISPTSDVSRWTRCDWSSTARRSLTKRSIGSWRRPGSGVAKPAACRRGTYCSMLEQSNRAESLAREDRNGEVEKGRIVSAKFLRNSRSICADTFAPGDRTGSVCSSPRATERQGTRISFGSGKSIPCSRSSGSSVAGSMLFATGTRP